MPRLRLALRAACGRLSRCAWFLFAEPQSLGVTDLEATELLLPLVERGLTDAVASADLRDGGTGLGFLEDLDDLFFGVPGSLHGSWVVENPLLKSGLNTGGSSPESA